jgi:hypothetical protein
MEHFFGDGKDKGLPIDLDSVRGIPQTWDQKFAASLYCRSALGKMNMLAGTNFTDPAVQKHHGHVGFGLSATDVYHRNLDEDNWIRRCLPPPNGRTWSFPRCEKRFVEFHVGRRFGGAVNKDQTGLFSDSHEAQP